MNYSRFALALSVGALVLFGITCTDDARRSVGHAISDAGRFIQDADGIRDAEAQTSSGECLQWEVQGFLPTHIRWQAFTTTNPDGTPNEYSLPVPDTFLLPEGWEPYAGEGLGAVIARRCARRS